MGAEDPLHWPIVTEYFAKAEAGQYSIPVCVDCGETHFPPRVMCPYCLSSEISLIDSDGDGHIYSFSVVHVDYHPTWGSRTPYVNALVRLDDGPVVFGNVVDCDPESVHVEDAVTIDFERLSSVTLPVFRTV